MSALSSLLALLLLVTTCSSVSSHEVLSPDELRREVNRLIKENGELRHENREQSNENRELSKENRKLNKENRELNKQVKQMTDGFTYLHDNSILAFRLTAGIGGNPYKKYTSVGDNDDRRLENAGGNCGCRTVDGSLPCNTHYRSRFLDLWPSSLIETVRVSVYVRGREVAFVRFNGHGSTYTNWFSADRVLDSSWKDLKTEPHNYFSLEGHVIRGHTRTFFINRDYRGCPADRGWLVVQEEKDVICTWGQRPPYPTILYSTLSTFGDQNNPVQFGQADVLTVTVKLRAGADLSQSYCP